MSQFFAIHPVNPEHRLIKQAVKVIENGGVIIFPTDCAYAIGCKLENKFALDRIRQLRKLDDKHNFTLICRDLSEISTYAVVDNTVFRLLKANTPGAYTFILRATKEVPRRLLHPKRSTIGLRVPDSQIVQALLTELNQPIMSVTPILPEQEFPMVDAEEIYEALGHHVDLIIDGGPCSTTPTTIVDLVEGIPKIIRVGKGAVSAFE